MVELTVSFLESLLWAAFQTGFHGSRWSSRLLAATHTCALAACLTVNIWLSDRSAAYSPYTVVVDFLLVLIYSMVFLNGNWYWKVFTVLLYNFCMIGSSFLTIAGFVGFLGIPMRQILEPRSWGRVGVLVMTKMLLVGMCTGLLLLRKKWNREKMFSWLLLILPVLATVTVSLLTELLLQYGQNTEQARQILQIMVSMIILVSMSFYLLKADLTGKWQRVQNDLLEEQIKQQKQIYQDQYENVREISKIHHDLKHKLIVAEQLLHRGKVEEAALYLNTFMKELNGFGEIAHGETVWETLLILKKKQAEEQGVRCIIDRKDGGLKQFRDTDICIILGNLIDNAIEAEEKLDGEKEIRIYLREEKGIVIVKVKNRIEETQTELPEFGNTTKKEKHMHGFGLKRMDEMVKRYGGTMSWNSENGWFYIELVFGI